MMGRQIGDQASLFYDFRLNDRMPQDPLLRRINTFGGLERIAIRPAAPLAGGFEQFFQLPAGRDALMDSRAAPGAYRCRRDGRKRP